MSMGNLLVLDHLTRTRLQCLPSLGRLGGTACHPAPISGTLRCSLSSTGKQYVWFVRCRWVLWKGVSL